MRACGTLIRDARTQSNAITILARHKQELIFFSYPCLAHTALRTAQREKVRQAVSVLRLSNGNSNATVESSWLAIPGIENGKRDYLLLAIEFPNAYQ